jgi:hypothetical protein
LKKRQLRMEICNECRELFRVPGGSRIRYCPKCMSKRVTENIESMRTGKGPSGKKWRVNLMRSLERKERGNK